MKNIMVFLLLAGMVCAATIDAPQMKQWSRDFYYTGDINCEGNASCAIGITTNVSCSFTVLSSVYGASGYIAVYNGPRPFRVMVDVQDNGRYSVDGSCTSGTESFSAVNYVEVQELSPGLQIIYILLLMLPFALVGYALYLLAMGRDFAIYPGAAVLAVVFKYSFNLINNYSFLSELWLIDVGVVIVAVILILFGMIREASSNGNNGRGRNGIQS